MARQNPMLKALDTQIESLEARRNELDSQIQVAMAIRDKLAGLVRKRSRTNRVPEPANSQP